MKRKTPLFENPACFACGKTLLRVSALKKYPVWSYRQVENVEELPGV